MMPEWRKEPAEVRERKPEHKEILELTPNVHITVKDYGTAKEPLSAWLFCGFPWADGDFAEFRDSAPAKILEAMQAAMPVLRAFVQGQSAQVDFPAAVDPVAAMERDDS